MTVRWFCSIMGDILGPFTIQQMAEKLKTGEIDMATLARRTDTPEYRPAWEDEFLRELPSKPPQRDAEIPIPCENLDLSKGQLVSIGPSASPDLPMANSPGRKDTQEAKMATSASVILVILVSFVVLGFICSRQPSTKRGVDRQRVFQDIEKALHRNSQEAESLYSLNDIRFDDRLDTLDSAAMQVIKARYGITDSDIRQIWVDGLRNRAREKSEGARVRLREEIQSFSGSSSPSINPTENEVKRSVTSEEYSLQIDRAKFEQIENGMTYAEVVGIVGHSGVLSTSGTIAGIDNQIYTWQNHDGSNAMVQFQNGKVIVKAQYGLR